MAVLFRFIQLFEGVIDDFSFFLLEIISNKSLRAKLKNQKIYSLFSNLRKVMSSISNDKFLVSINHSILNLIRDRRIIFFK